MRKSSLLLVLLLAGCNSDNPSAPSPVTPPLPPSPAPTTAPTPTGPSPFAGNWDYRTTLTAVDRNCGHTPADIGTTVGPFRVTVATDGTFTLPGGSPGVIDPAGTATFTLVPAGGDCGGGTGDGGCRADHNHCDGTSVQAGDVRKWTLVRQ